MSFELPMFPLGSVTVPGSALPLRVFEPRYRELIERCLASDRRFGTALIERGSEVGGGDVRSGVGTILTIVQAESSPDGQWAILAVAIERLRIVRWLVDAPHPLAVVDPWPDAEADDRTTDLLDRAELSVVAWLTRASELGLPTPPIDLDPIEDPTLRSFRLVALSPLGPLDRQRLLEADGPSHRCEVLLEAMDGQIELLEARFGGPAD